MAALLERVRQVPGFIYDLTGAIVVGPESDAYETAWALFHDPPQIPTPPPIGSMHTAVRIDAEGAIAMRAVDVPHVFGRQCGTLVIEVPKPTDENESLHAGIVQLVKETGRNLSMSMGVRGRGRRRGILLLNLDHLRRHLQIALRKIMDASVETSVFVFTAKAPTVRGVDAALLSRVLLLRMRSPPPPLLPSTSSPVQGQAGLKKFAKSFLDRGTALMGILTALSEREDADDETLRRITSVAAEADHKAACMTGNPKADTLALELVYCSVNPRVLPETPINTQRRPSLVIPSTKSKQND